MTSTTTFLCKTTFEMRTPLFRTLSSPNGVHNRLRGAVPSQYTKIMQCLIVIELVHKAKQNNN